MLPLGCIVFAFKRNIWCIFPRSVDLGLLSRALGRLPLRIVAPVTEWKDHYSRLPWLVRIVATKRNGLAKDSAAEYEKFVARKKASRERVRALGRKLGWDSKTIQAARRPSVSWLARKTGREDVYEYIYCATSRFVHFNVQGLLRLAWYKPGSLSVRSEHFRDYSGAFSLQ